MKVWINKRMSGDTLEWRISAGRTIMLFNNTGRVGKVFENIFLGYRRDGRKHIMSLNRNAKRQPVEKTVGIWISESDYDVVSTGEIWTGKATYGNKIDGRFGIYNVGTVIECEGYTWLLKEDKGWVIVPEDISYQLGTGGNIHG